MLNHLDGIWSYATTEWLRLTLPNLEDKTRTRWPIHPLWGYLTSVDWNTNDSPLSSRFNTARVPGNNWLFNNGLSTLISFMAREGIHDFDAGINVFKNSLYDHHERKSFYLGLPFDDYINEKVASKARQFNSILNRQVEAEEQAELNRSAAEYRKRSDGE